MERAQAAEARRYLRKAMEPTDPGEVPRVRVAVRGVLDRGFGERKEEGEQVLLLLFFYVYNSNSSPGPRSWTDG